MTRKQKAAIRRWRYLNWGLIISLLILATLYATVILIYIKSFGV